MLKLNDAAFVDPLDVQSVVIVGGQANALKVTMKGTGDAFLVQADYGRSIYSTQDRLVREIEAAKGQR